MNYIGFSLLGGAVFLITSLLDYYWTKTATNITRISNDSLDPSDIPVGSRPDSDEIHSYETEGLEQRSRLLPTEPTIIGYILAVILQLPALLSIFGVI